MRYRQKPVNCVSECLCREISRALMIGNSLGLTTFTFPAKPGYRSLWLTRRNLLWQRRQTRSTSPWRFVLHSIRERGSSQLVVAAPFLKMRPRKLTNLGLTHWSLACCSPSIPSLTDRFGRRADQRVKRTIFLYLIVQPEEHHPGPLNDLNANERLNSDRVSPTTVTSICLIPDKPRFSRYSTPPNA
jgi:hypothetical protein